MRQYLDRATCLFLEGEYGMMLRFLKEAWLAGEITEEDADYIIDYVEGLR